MKSVVTKMISVMIIICIVGMAVIITFGAAMSGSSLRGESLDKINNGVLAEAMTIESWFGEKVSAISTLAADIKFIENQSDENFQALFKTHLAADPDCFDIYIGFPDGTAVFSDGWIPGDDWKSYNRGWYKGAAGNPGKVYISDIYTDAQTSEYVVSVSKAVTDKSGVFVGVVCADIFVTVVGDIIFNIDVAKDSYSFAVDNNGDILIHPNKDYSPVYHADTDEDEFKSLKEIGGGVFSGMWEKTKNGGNAVSKDASGVKKEYVAVVIPATDWRLYIAVPISTVNASLYRFLFILTPLSLIAVAALVFSGAVIVRSINKVLRESALSLQESVTEIVSTSHNLLTNADTLAQTDSNQAASIEETSAAMNQTASMSESNTKNTNQALILTNETSMATSEGIEKISSLIKFMDELSDSSKEISNVIKEISGIASQTNILSLNASVESVRAGEAGKAFSVVSEEVRALAQRCNDAVENTAAIIEKNVGLTEQSIKNSREVSDTFEAISDKMAKVNQIVAEIATASEEQSKGVGHVNRALSEMEKLTQSNASIAQEADAAANTLSSHSEVLQEITDKIKKLVGQA